MKLRIVGVIAAMFLGGAWAMAQAPGSPFPGTPAPVNPPYGGPGLPTPAASRGPVYNAAPGPQYGTPDLNGAPVLPSEAVNGAGPSNQFWAGADYLLWRIRSEQLPSVTLSAPAGLSVSLSTTDVTITQGAATTTTTSTVVSPVFIQASGNTNSINVGDHNGGRIFAGYWLDPEKTCGIDGSFFFLERRGGNFINAAAFTPTPNLIDSGLSSTITIVTPATINTPAFQTTQGPFPLLILASTNSNLVASTTNQMLGAELNTRWTCFQIGSFTFGSFAGFRYFNFNEELNIADQATMNLSQATFATNPNPPPANLFGTSLPQNLSLSTTDSIRTRNNFYGGQVGADVEAYFGNFFINARGKLGLGVMHEVVDVNGSTSFDNGNGNVTTKPGGLLTGIGDIGSHNRDRIAYIGEVNLKLGYEVAWWLRLYVGYDGLGVSNVARPDLQTAISTTNLSATVAGTTTQVTLSQPTLRFSDASIWAQGINFGFELRY